jgi:hypothetical protein
MYIYFILAAVLLVITYWDYRRAETDTVFLLEWWAWFDVSRSSWPTLYWLCISVQLIGVVVLLICGFRNV